MKRKVLVLLAAFLLAGTPLFAADGDLIVNGKVGIGTTAPSTKVQVAADSSGLGETTNAQLSISGLTDPNKRLSLGFNTTYDVGWIQSVHFGTSSKPLALQPNGGNVGIGTTDPKGKFSVGFNNDDEIVMYAVGDDCLGIQTTLNGQPISTFGGNANQLILQPVVGTVGIGLSPGAYKFAVLGDAYATGYWQSSDLQFKENILPVDSPLAKILSLQGVTYNWKTQEFKDKGFPEGKQYGFVAQEVEKTIPEIVKDNSNGEKAISYDGIIPVLVEAMKAQQKQIEELKSEIAALRAKF